MGKKHTLIVLLNVMTFAFSCFENDNPFDENGTNYTPPQITINENASSVRNRDTIHFDTIAVALSGNREECRFNLKVDDDDWSEEWKPEGTFGLSGLADGKHTLYIHSMYDGGGRVVSDSITFYVLTKGYRPEFKQENDSTITIFEGKRVAFTDHADGVAPLTYLWLKGKSVLEGKNSDTLKFASFSSNDTASYQCVVTNEYGKDTGRTFILKYRTFSGGIKAVVTDVLNNKLKSAIVTLSPSDKKDTTDATGSFTFSSLSGNTYSLKVSLPEYHDTTLSEIAVNDSETIILPTITLKMIVAATFGVTYDGNGSDGGTVPVDSNRYYKGKEVTVAGNPGNLHKEGYTFAGWSPAKGGKGDNYTSGDTFVIGTSDTTLYVHWEINSYTITFNTRGGSVLAAQTANYGNTVAEPSPPTKKSYIFAGWYNDFGCLKKWNFSTDIILGEDTLFAKWVIMDVDGNVYTEVKIGDQVWMVENLKVTKYCDGIPIAEVSDQTNWQNLDLPAYCWYQNDSAAYKNPYGALYNWYVVNPENSRNVAPEGWHVPSDSEWTELQNYLITNGYNWDGTTESNKIAKSLAVTTIWNTEKGEGIIGYELSKNNKSGFSSYPSGRAGDEFCCIGNRCYWWSTTENNTYEANYRDEVWHRCLDYYYDYLERSGTPKWFGESIRCLRDW